MPSIAGKYSRELNWDGKVVQSCVHCHQVSDAIRLGFREKKQPIPANWIYPFPAPETIGLTLAADRIARVETVVADSVAATAGLRVGDEIISLGGQPLLSIADVSWALHRAPDAGPLPATLSRSGVTESVSITLPPNWRTKSDISRRVGTWPMRGMAFGGLVLEELTEAERALLKVGTGDLALRVKHVGQYGIHATAKKAGFEKDDIVVAIDGFTERLGEGELLGRLLQKRPAGEKIDATVRRGSKQVALTLPMQ
jgi:S1-C subfamily serine protease